MSLCVRVAAMCFVFCVFGVSGLVGLWVRGVCVHACVTECLCVSVCVCVCNCVFVRA